MIEFIRKILPVRGIYCVATKKTQGFHHTFWDTIEKAYAAATAVDNRGETVYMAQAVFKTPENRKQDNVSALRSFYLDIDCGEDKPYKTQIDGIAALKAFCASAGVPLPAVVNSGNGLYAYWPLDRDLIPTQWRGTAIVLKGLCKKLGFEVDHSRTTDTASVLRPIGIHHRKAEPKMAKLLRDVEPFNFDEFCNILKQAAEAHKIEAEVLEPPKHMNMYDEFSIGLSPGMVCAADAVADKCPQINTLRESRGIVPEPLWYASIGILRYCEDGNAKIHEWSSGFAGYSHTETEAKIAQHQMPPTTCEYIGQLNPSGCVGCKNNGKVKTPLVLGKKLTELKVDPETRCEIPAGFILTASGIFTKEDNIRVYPFDLYPSSLSYDETMGYETVDITHTNARGKVKTFTVRSSLVHDPKLFLTVLHDNHVQTVGSESKKLLVAYMESYLEKLRTRTALARLCSQMGWQKNADVPTFVLGSSIFTKHNPKKVIGFAQNVPEVVKSYTTKGTLDAWRSETKIFNEPGLEAHAFMFIAGAFGAPLIHFTGYSGAMVCAVGTSGTGKSMVQHLIQSVYGDPRRLGMVADDTSNALISRLGVSGSLPMTIDEVSNIDPQRLSDLAYRVTQGRDKIRLTRKAVERTTINSWCTCATVSSNHSLIDKLGILKGDPSAEVNRIFEFHVKTNEHAMKTLAPSAYATTTDNFGLAGEKYIQYLVDNYETHGEAIRDIQDKIRSIFKFSGEERFWSMIIAVTLYGAKIATDLGLIDFPAARLIPWIKTALDALRGSKGSVVLKPEEMLGEFVNTYAANIVVVAAKGNNSKESFVYRLPMGAVMGRYEVDTRKIYLDAHALKTFFTKRGVSPSSVTSTLENSVYSPLVSATKRKSFVQGVPNMAGGRVLCWELDAAHPVFGNMLALVESDNKVAIGGVK